MARRQLVEPLQLVLCAPRAVWPGGCRRPPEGGKNDVLGGIGRHRQPF